MRDLPVRSRLAAVALALALLLPGATAFLHFSPDWFPAGDNASIALRALDVGTPRTPLTGMPSLARNYTESRSEARQPGPLEFYWLAPFVRLFGSATGMLLGVAVFSGAAVLLSAWVVFRQLGPTAGVFAAACLALVVFTRGSASLTDPMNSAFAGYPLLLTAVTVWGLVCGDLRLLPLTILAASFAAQSHLSVLPSLTVLAPAALVGVIMAWRAERRDGSPAGTRSRRTTVALSALTLTVWIPPVLQQLRGDPGNLSEILAYATHNDTPTKGWSVALHEVVNVLGWPPLLGRTQLHWNSAWDLMGDPSAAAWTAATATIAVLAFFAVRWRRDHDRRSLLVLMAAVMIAAGLLNGATVPAGLEEGSLTFYHWIWPLTFLVALGLALAAGDTLIALRRALPGPRIPSSPLVPLGTALAIAAMAAAAIAGPALDRPANALAAMSLPFPRRVYDSLTEQVIADRDRIPRGPVLLISRGEAIYDGNRRALALALEESGLPVLHPPESHPYTADERIATNPDEIRSVLLLALVFAGDTTPGTGSLLGHVGVWPGAALEAYSSLLARLEAAPNVVLDPQIPEMFTGWEEMWPLLEQDFADRLEDDPKGALIDDAVVSYLRDYPPVQPRLDSRLLEEIHTALKSATTFAHMEGVAALDVWLVTGEELDRLLGRESTPSG